MRDMLITTLFRSIWKEQIETLKDKVDFVVTALLV
jgi:hypothetical protein